MRKLIFLLPFALASCTGNNSSSAVKSTDTAQDTAVKQQANLSDLHSLTESWTASLNLKNAPIMKSFYADTVKYYGDKITSDEVVNRQQAYFTQNPDYHMKIGEYLSEEQQPDGNWRVRITKTVTAGGKTADYPASLVYGKIKGVWKIISESDDITDLNKASAVTIHYAPETVTVEGLLEQTTGFNTADKTQDAKSAGKESYYIIWPTKPLDVVAGSPGETTEKNVDRVQLNGNEKTITPLLNKKVRITGTLSHAKTPDQFTRVILDVKTIEEVK